jgi:hypothetical protein
MPRSPLLHHQDQPESRRCSWLLWVLLSTATSQKPHMEPLGIPGAWVFARAFTPTTEAASRTCHWPTGVERVMSQKDATAPTLAEAERAGLLPSYQTYLDYAASRDRKARSQPG